MKRRDKIIAGVLGSVGVLALGAGILILALLPTIVRKLVESQVALTDGSFSEKTWKLPPFAIGMQFWIFNVSNPEAVLQTGAKPILDQKGPYGFREKQWKYNIDFTNDNVIYLNRKLYYFDATLSCQWCRESDTFVVPNIPYLTVLKMIRGKTPGISLPTRMVQWMLTMIGETPFAYNIQAKEFLFEGYKDKIFDMINMIKRGAVPDRMGVFYGKNASSDGVYEINTGAKDASSVGQIVRWNNHTDLSFTGWWRPQYPQSSMINGSDGTIYPPFRKRTDALPIFVTDICRSLYVTYKSDVTYKGLSAYRYTVPPEIFDEDRPENRGFCWPMFEKYYQDQPREGYGWCYPSGLLDVSKCQNGAPVVVSSPHFLFCPDEVQKSVVGLDPPDENRDNTFLDIEPTTGVILAGARKIQLNVAMYNDAGNPSYKAFNHLKSVIIPIVMINESVVIDDETLKYVYDNVVVSQRAANIGSYVAIGIGALLILVVVALISYRCVQDVSRRSKHNHYVVSCDFSAQKRNREAPGRWNILPEPGTSSVG